jgi:hypothetical protein
MADTLPRHYIIGIVMFGFLIVGGMSMLGIFAGTSDTFATGEKYTQFNNTFNVLDDVTDQVESMEESITEADTDFGIFGVLNALISSAWQTLKLLFSSLSFMDGVFFGLSSVFGVPGFIPGTIILLVTVILIFAIFSAIFQREL